MQSPSPARDDRQEGRYGRQDVSFLGHEVKSKRYEERRSRSPKEPHPDRMKDYRPPRDDYLHRSPRDRNDEERHSRRRERMRSRSASRRRRRDDEDDNTRDVTLASQLRRRRSRLRSLDHNGSRRRQRRPSSSRSASPSHHRRQESRRSPPPPHLSIRSHTPLPSQQTTYANEGAAGADSSASALVKAVERQKADYNPSGKLAAETNTVAGTTIVLKYNEPPESRKPAPSQAWRLYVFKGELTLNMIELWTRSCWLFGRESAVVDVAIEHPSCSKQHAVLQFRWMEKRNEYGDRIGAVRPYVIDLESANGTKVNGEAVPERRFVELRSGDVLSFGDSTREYVLILPPAG